MFYSKTKPRSDAGLHVGRKTKNTYSIDVDIYGQKTIKKTGETDFYSKIQEELEGTKIENIIKRAQLGDISALNKKTPLFGDFTAAPVSLAEAQNTINKMEQAFEKLPIDVRREYGFSTERFIADAGSAQWNKLMGIETPNQTPAAKPSITPGEVKVEDVIE